MAENFAAAFAEACADLKASLAAIAGAEAELFASRNYILNPPADENRQPTVLPPGDL